MPIPAADFHALMKLVEDHRKPHEDVIIFVDPSRWSPEQRELAALIAESDKE
jgi:hypothetical protein